MWSLSVCTLSHVQLFVTRLLSMGSPRQEFWTGLPFPSPGDLLNPGIKPTSPALAGGFFTAEPPGKPHILGWGDFKLKSQGKIIQQQQMTEWGKNALNFATAPGSLWSMHWQSSDKPSQWKIPMSYFHFQPPSKEAFSQLLPNNIDLPCQPSCKDANKQ